VLVIVVVLAGVGWLSWATNYQPATPFGGGAGWVDPAYAKNIGDFSPPYSGDSFSEFQVRFRDGEIFRYAFTLTNQGVLPVTVRWVGAPDDGVNILRYERTLVTPRDGPDMYNPRRALPFAPFALHHGEQRMVVIVTTFADCASLPRSPRGKWADTTTYSRIRIGVSILGIEHADWISLPYNLEVARHGPCRTGP
jgi:hypothetical protein